MTTQIKTMAKPFTLNQIREVFNQEKIYAMRNYEVWYKEKYQHASRQQYWQYEVARTLASEGVLHFVNGERLHLHQLRVEAKERSIYFYMKEQMFDAAHLCVRLTTGMINFRILIGVMLNVSSEWKMMPAERRFHILDNSSEYNSAIIAYLDGAFI